MTDVDRKIKCVREKMRQREKTKEIVSESDTSVIWTVSVNKTTQLQIIINFAVC